MTASMFTESTDVSTDAVIHVSNGSGVQTVSVAIQISWMRILYLIIAALGIACNGTVITVIGLSKSLRRTWTNGFILNQSVVDLLTCILLILHTVDPDEKESYTTAADTIFCRFWHTRHPLWAMMVSSTYNLVVITIERYIAVCHPIWYRNKFGKLAFAIGLVFIWVSGPLINSYQWILASVKDGHCIRAQYPSLASRRAAGIISSIVQFILPIAVHVACYARIAWVILGKKKVAPATQQASNPSSKKDQKVTNINTKISRNIVKTLVAVVLAFFLCWVCNSTIWMLSNMGVAINKRNPFYDFTVVMVFANCTVNPIVYIAKYEAFKKRLSQLIRKGHITDNSTAGESSTGGSNT